MTNHSLEVAMDPYEVLGISKDATEAQIKAAYKKLAKKHHPDAGGKRETFQRVQMAYDILKDAQERAYYDQHGHKQQPPSLEAQASAVITIVIKEFLEKKSIEDLIYTDMIGGLIQLVSMQLDAVTSAEKDLKFKIATMKKLKQTLKKRLKFKKDKKENLFFVIVEQRLTALRAGLKGTKETIKILKKAISLLKDYDFKFDEKPVRSPANAWTEFLHSSTTTEIR